MSTENVDDVIKDLKKIQGFAAYAILNNDGMKKRVCRVYPHISYTLIQE